MNAAPTLPAKFWPATIMGAPNEIEIKAVVASLVPPGPVAVSVIVVLPLSFGVPVIFPVVAFRVAQLGSDEADQLVAGKLPLSVSAGVATKATPTLPVKVCPAGMMGAPAEMVTVTGVTALVPPAPVAEMLIVASPNRAVPVISPVAVLRVAHGGKELALHDVGVRSAASVSAGVALKISPVLGGLVKPIFKP